MDPSPLLAYSSQSWASRFTLQAHLEILFCLALCADKVEVGEMEELMKQLEASSDFGDAEGEGDLLDDFVVGAAEVSEGRSSLACLYLINQLVCVCV